MPDLEANKSIATNWLEQVSNRDLDGMLSTTAPTWRLYGGPPGLPEGPAGVRELMSHLHQVKQRWTIDDVIAENDRVVVRATNNCEQESFLGIPAAGVHQVFTASFTFRISDGLVQEIWRNADDLGRLLQLGAQITGPDSPRAG